jgi:hypothetical protein
MKVKENFMVFGVLTLILISIIQYLIGARPCYPFTLYVLLAIAVTAHSFEEIHTQFWVDSPKSSLSLIHNISGTNSTKAESYFVIFQILYNLGVWINAYFVFLKNGLANNLGMALSLISILNLFSHGIPVIKERQYFPGSITAITGGIIGIVIIFYVFLS